MQAQKWARPQGNTVPVLFSGAEMFSPLFPLLPFSFTSSNDDIIMYKVGPRSLSPPWAYREQYAPLILMRFLRTYCSDTYNLVSITLVAYLRALRYQT